MLGRKSLIRRVGWLLAALTLALVGSRPVAIAQQGSLPLPKVSIQGDTNVFQASFTNPRDEGNGLIADLTLTNAGHPIWYVVRIGPSGRAFQQAQLPQRWILPACTTDGLARFTCQDVLVKSVPMIPNNSLDLIADGIGNEPQTAQELQAIYGMEIAWRVAFGQPLPADYADALEEEAIQVGDWSEEALGATPVVAGFWQVGKAAKAVSSGDVDGLIHAVNDALNDPAIQNWLNGRGVDVSGIPYLDVADRVQTLLQLDLGILIEKWVKPSDATGYLDVRLDAPTANAGPPSAPAPQPAPTPAPPPGPPAPTVLYQADWSKGLNGWTGSPDWKTTNGMLVNDGTGPFTCRDGGLGGCPGSIILAPFRAPSADYAVEAEFQAQGGWYSAITLRRDENGSYDAGVQLREGVAYIAETNGLLFSRTPYSPRDGWHRFRVEARGNQIMLYVDGSLMNKASDNRHLSGTQVGFDEGNGQMSIRSFKILALQ